MHSYMNDLSFFPFIILHLYPMWALIISSFLDPMNRFKVFAFAYLVIILQPLAIASNDQFLRTYLRYDSLLQCQEFVYFETHILEFFWHAKLKTYILLESRFPPNLQSFGHMLSKSTPLQFSTSFVFTPNIQTFHPIMFTISFMHSWCMHSTQFCCLFS